MKRDENLTLPDKKGTTGLHHLIAAGNPELAYEFLERNPDYNAVDAEGNTPLHTLLQQRKPNVELVQVLLSRGADPNVKNMHELTPFLSWGGDFCDIEKIQDLFSEAGADLGAVDRSGAGVLLRLLRSSTGVSPKGVDTAEYRKTIESFVTRSIQNPPRDFQGRTCLHVALEALTSREPSYGRIDDSLLELLVGLGFDVHAVDNHGNGLLHTLALHIGMYKTYFRTKEYWNYLFDLGLDPEQKNNHGRTPLHILCASSTWLSQRAGTASPIDLFIARMNTIDHVDHDGYTPLHIAVTGNQMDVKKLLDAGADPEKRTREGLNPLHIASRCRSSNVVGMLLDAIRKKHAGDSSRVASSTTAEGAEGLSPVFGVNMHVKHLIKGAITPLYYAARSGRPESVALLLEAGADVKAGRVIEACFEFEDEDRRWKNPQKPEGTEAIGFVSGLGLYEASRPSQVPRLTAWQRTPSDHDTARLEEILSMTINRDADLSWLPYHTGKALSPDLSHKEKEGLVSRAFKENKDYTVACFKDAYDLATAGLVEDVRELFETPYAKHLSEKREESATNLLMGFQGFQPGRSNQEIFLRALIRKEYHLVVQLAHMGADFLVLGESGLGPSLLSNLVYLIQGGYSSLVERIGDIEAKRGHESGQLHAFNDKTQTGLHPATQDNKDFKLLLVHAVQRKLPNMEVVRLLVEKFRVDIHEEYEFLAGKAVYFEQPEKRVATALSLLAGGNNWWQVHQALPYLLQKSLSEDPQRLNLDQLLHDAVRAHKQSPFAQDAVKILIEAGADVNAPDDKYGQSCLAVAAGSTDMITFLMAHGAEVKPDAIIMAIGSHDIDTVRAFLAGGIDANMRDEIGQGTQSSEVDYNLKPLLQLAGRFAKPNRYDGIHRTEQRIEVFRTLLDHGADPFAKYLSPISDEDDDFEPEAVAVSTSFTPTIVVPAGYEERTTLHALLLDNILPDTIFLTDLDVNHRDARGRNILMLACQTSWGLDYVLGSWRGDLESHHNTTLFDKLMSLGADVKARDNMGLNVLHYAAFAVDQDRVPVLAEQAMRKVVQMASELLEQEDGDGNTPLAYALERRRLGLVELLLSAGASLDTINKKGNNALHLLASTRMNAKAASLFENIVNRGIDIKARNADGETPLFVLCKAMTRYRKSPWPPHIEEELPDATDPRIADEENTITMMQRFGADVSTRDSKGRGLLHILAKGDSDTFKRFMDIGLDPFLKDDQGHTAFDAAKMARTVAILKHFGREGSQEVHAALKG